MLVRLVGNSSMIAMEVEADVTWSAGFTGEHGTASLTMYPRTKLWDLLYLRPEGGTYVEVVTPYGMFRGIMDAPTFVPGSATAEIMPPSVWLDARLVGFNHTFQALTAGAIARLAAEQALAGAGTFGIVPGAFCAGGAIIPTYQFNGQSLLSVYTDLTEKSGEEWEVDEQGRLNWQPYCGRYHDLVLVDNGRLLGSDQATGLRDRSEEVIEQDSKGLQHSAIDNSLPVLWPRQTLGSQDQ